MHLGPKPLVRSRLQGAMPERQESKATLAATSPTLNPKTARRVFLRIPHPQTSPEAYTSWLNRRPIRCTTSLSLQDESPPPLFHRYLDQAAPQQFTDFRECQCLGIKQLLQAHPRLNRTW